MNNYSKTLMLEKENALLKTTIEDLTNALLEIGEMVSEQEEAMVELADIISEESYE